MPPFQDDRGNFVDGNYNNVRGNYNNNYNGNYYDLRGNTSPHNIDSFNRSKTVIIDSFNNNDADYRLEDLHQRPWRNNTFGASDPTLPPRARRSRPQNQDGYNNEQSFPSPPPPLHRGMSSPGPQRRPQPHQNPTQQWPNHEYVNEQGPVYANPNGFPHQHNGYNGTTPDFDDVYGGGEVQPPPPQAPPRESRRAPTQPTPQIIAPTPVPNARKASNNPFEPYYNGNFDRQASLAEDMNRLTIPEHSPWQEGAALVSEPEDLAPVSASSRTSGSSMYTNDRPARSRGSSPLSFPKPETLDHRPPHSRGTSPLPFPKPEVLNNRPARSRGTSPLPVPETLNGRPARSRGTSPLPVPETLNGRPARSRGTSPLPIPGIDRPARSRGTSPLPVLKPEILDNRPVHSRGTSPLPVPEISNNRSPRSRGTSPLPVPDTLNDRSPRSRGTSPLPVPKLEILGDSTALSIASRITSVISDKPSYQNLLRTEWSRAQRLVDISQAVLESSALDPKSRCVLVVTIQRFAKRAGVYPRAYMLEGVKKMGKGCTAEGAYGTVHRGYYQNRNVCLKALKQDSRNTGMNLHLSKVVAREAILWRQLDHRNILPFYGICELEIGLCMVSPWMRQGNLREYMRGGTVTGEERLLVAKDVAEGLKYLHSYEIIHGDLKGENVLVDSVGRARIADFGLTSIDDPAIAYWASQSRVASRGGNFAFQAPEILNKDDADNTKASDMYAYGCVCYELYFGEEPWKGSKREVMTRKLNNELPKCPEESSIVWKCGLTQTIWSLMEETWRFQPDQRPYASEVVEKLSKMIDRDHRDLEEDEQDPEAEFITRWCRGRSEDDPVSSGMRQKFMIPTLEEVEELLRLP